MARYHVYTDAKHPDGGSAVGHTLTFYTTQAATTLAVLYVAETGPTERANPYGITGMVDFWTEDTSLWVVSDFDLTPDPVFINLGVPTSPVSVMDLGALGDGVTDDTVAIQNAMDAVVDTPASLYFPPGDYLVSHLTLEDLTTGINIVGAGREITRIVSTTAGAILSLGVFDSTPATPWIGTAAGLRLSGITLQCIPDTTIAHVAAGDQTVIGIQDNGSGSVTLRDVSFWGLKYGVFAPYGHDYCRYYDVDFYYCTTSIYVGPGSEQFYIFGGSSTLHDRAIVIEGAAQGVVNGFVFNEPHTRDIDILSPDTLESGISGNPVLPQLEMAWTFNDCWHETGAGWATGWGPTEHVRLGNASDTNTVYGIVFNNVTLMSGTTGMAAHTGGVVYAFLNAHNASVCTIHKILIHGDYIEAIVTIPDDSAFPSLHVHDAKTVGGYTPIPAFDPVGYYCVEYSQWRVFQKGLGVYGDTEANVALKDLLTKLAMLGIIIDNTTGGP
jgi:hypothetical protein